MTCLCHRRGQPSPPLSKTDLDGQRGPFRSFAFEAFIAAHPELRHVRTRVRTPGQNGSRERCFGTMKYEWLFREEIDHGLELVEQINAYRHDYNHVRPHEAIACNRPADVYAGLADPTIPNFEIEETLPPTRRGTIKPDALHRAWTGYRWLTPQSGYTTLDQVPHHRRRLGDGGARRPAMDPWSVARMWDSGFRARG